MALRFDQAGMIVRWTDRVDTEWYRPCPAGVRGPRLVEPTPGPSGLGRIATPTAEPKALREGGPKRGDRRVAKPGRYHVVSTRLRALRSSPLRPVAMPLFVRQHTSYFAR